MQTRRTNNRVICWDLDDTCIGERGKSGKIQLTRGLMPQLEGLRRLGCRHVLTTAAIKSYAELMLRVFNVSRLFDKVFARNDICPRASVEDYNKHYGVVATDLGFSDSEAQHNILVLGNLARDAPTDMDLVFLLHPFGNSSHAAVFGRILATLIDRSDSWSDACESLISGCNGHHHAYPGGRFDSIDSQIFSDRSHWQEENFEKDAGVLNSIEGRLISIRHIGLLVGKPNWTVRVPKKNSKIILVNRIPEDCIIENDPDSSHGSG